VGGGVEDVEIVWLLTTGGEALYSPTKEKGINPQGGVRRNWKSKLRNICTCPESPRGMTAKKRTKGDVTEKKSRLYAVLRREGEVVCKEIRQRDGLWGSQGGGGWTPYAPHAKKGGGGGEGKKYIVFEEAEQGISEKKVCGRGRDTVVKEEASYYFQKGRLQCWGLTGKTGPRTLAKTTRGGEKVFSKRKI